MTQPGYIFPPQLGWWVRTGTVGAGSGTFGWTVTGSGAAYGGVAALTITETAATSASHSSSSGAALTIGVNLLASFSSIGNAALTITETPAVTARRNVFGASALTITETATASGTKTLVGDAALTITETPNITVSQNVSYDATGTITDVSNQSSYNINTSGTHTATAGADVFVWLAVLTSGGAEPTFTATYGGTSMIQLAFVKANNAQYGSLALFYLANVTGGAQSIAASASVTSGTIKAICGSSESYNNVGSVNKITTNYGQSNSLSVAATGEASGKIIGQLAGENTSVVNTLSAFNKTQRYLHSTISGNLNDVAMVVGDTAATGSQSFTATSSDGACQWGGIAAVLLNYVVPTISYDTTGAGYTANPAGASSASGSFTHTGAAGATPVVAVFTNMAGAAASSYTRTAHYNGASMTSLGYLDGNGQPFGWLEFFGLIGASTGSADTVAFSISGGPAVIDQVAVNSVSYHNVVSFGTAVTHGQDVTSLTSNAITTAPALGEMVIQGFQGADQSGTEVFSAYNHNVRWGPGELVNGANSLGYVVGDAPGAASVTFTCTASRSCYQASVAIPLLNQ